MENVGWKGRCPAVNQERDVYEGCDFGNDDNDGDDNDDNSYLNNATFL